MYFPNLRKTFWPRSIGAFIEFAIEKQVLKFGEFTLKSGRISPYFFNAGLFNTGRDLARLGRFYAAALQDSGIDYDLLFGPAYKGIPIATTTAVALSNDYDLDLPYCFNRKEAKTHGEGGSLVGSELTGKVMLVDEPTAGLAKLLSEDVYAMLIGLRDSGITILLVDQEIRQALKIADYVYVLELGRNKYEGAVDQFNSPADLKKAFWA